MDMLLLASAGTFSPLPSEHGVFDPQKLNPSGVDPEKNQPDHGPTNQSAPSPDNSTAQPSRSGRYIIISVAIFILSRLLTLGPKMGQEMQQQRQQQEKFQHDMDAAQQSIEQDFREGKASDFVLRLKGVSREEYEKRFPRQNPPTDQQDVSTGAEETGPAN